MSAADYSFRRCRALRDCEGNTSSHLVPQACDPSVKDPKALGESIIPGQTNYACQTNKLSIFYLIISMLRFLGFKFEFELRARLGLLSVYDTNFAHLAPYCIRHTVTGLNLCLLDCL